MKIIPLIFCLTLFLSCTDLQPEKVFTKSKPTAEVLIFFSSKNFKLYQNKHKIPNMIIDSLSRIDGDDFKIGDTSDSGNINLSDISFNNIVIDSVNSDGNAIFKIKDSSDIDFKGLEYNKTLHFILLNDTLCLISYTQGGLGTHGVIDFFQYKGKFTHTRYMTIESLIDTNMLGIYLRANPLPEIESNK